VLALLLLGVILGGGAGNRDEYEIKAGFLYNFALYTTWVEGAFDDREEGDVLAPLVIAVVGKDPFKRHLDEVARHEVKDRAIRLRRFADLEAFGEAFDEDIFRCHMLFAGRTLEGDVEKLVELLEEEPVFTVSDLYDFTRRGGVARFLVESGNVKIEINTDAARRAGLQISSQLLKLVTIVEDED